jgi:hypothetical protein
MKADCNAPVNKPGAVHCQEHNDYYRMNEKRRIQEVRGSGVCIISRCEKPLALKTLRSKTESKNYCEGHLNRRRIDLRRRSGIFEQYVTDELTRRLPKYKHKRGDTECARRYKPRDLLNIIVASYCEKFGISDDDAYLTFKRKFARHVQRDPFACYRFGELTLCDARDEETCLVLEDIGEGGHEIFYIR